MSEPTTQPGKSLTAQMEDELDLLRRHIAILKEVKKSGPVGIIRLSGDTQIPQHKVRYSLRLLEGDGLIKASAQGAVATEALDEFKPRMEELLEIMTQTATDLRQDLKEL